MESSSSAPGEIRAGGAWIRAMLLLAFAAIAWAWWNSEGYQRADAVEYVERARAFAADGQLDVQATNLRSFAFSALFVPLFAAAEAIGFTDERVLFPLARLFQIALSLWLVWATFRLGERLAGRRAGLMAGLLIALNPIFLRYGMAPVADVGAALFTVLGILRLADRSSFRSALLGGLLLGIGCLAAYKVLAVVGALALILLLVDRLRFRARWAGMTAGVVAALLIGAAIDRWAYGEWGLSLRMYVADNGLGILSRLTYELGWESAAREMYAWRNQLRDIEFDASVPLAEPRQRMGRMWYASHLTELLVVPALALVAIGCTRGLFRRDFLGRVLVLVSASYVLLLLGKGDKSFRLWLPILPLLLASGAAFASALAQNGRPWSRGVVLLLLVSAAALGPWQFLRASPRRYGAFWQGMEYINSQERERTGNRAKVASSLYFAIYLRGAPTVEHVRFEFGPWDWPKPEVEDEPLGVAVRHSILETLDGLDWLLITEAPLFDRAGLLRAVQKRFELKAVFFEEGAHTERFGPVYVMRRSAGRGAEEFARLGTVEALGSSDVELRGEEVFVDPDGIPHLKLLGWEHRLLPGTGFALWTTHWAALERLECDLSLVACRVGEVEDERVVPLGFGLGGTSNWRPTTVLSHGWVLRPSARQGDLQLRVAAPQGEECVELVPASRTQGGEEWLKIETTGVGTREH